RIRLRRSTLPPDSLHSDTTGAAAGQLCGRKGLCAYNSLARSAEIIPGLFMAGLLWQVFNILKEIFHRTLKFPELLLTLLGLRFTKKLKLRVVVLRDERGLPLVSNDEVIPAFEEARRILARTCGV